VPSTGWDPTAQGWEMRVMTLAAVPLTGKEPALLLCFQSPDADPAPRDSRVLHVVFGE